MKLMKIKEGAEEGVGQLHFVLRVDGTSIGQEVVKHDRPYSVCSCADNVAFFLKALKAGGRSSLKVNQRVLQFVLKAQRVRGGALLEGNP